MEAEDYLQYLKGKTQERNKRKWILDLSWLQSRGVELPDAVKVEHM